MTTQSDLNIEVPVAEEGVIKYQLQHTSKPIDLPVKVFAQIQGWRSLLFTLGLIGQDEHRYGGLSYGNISQRIAWGYEQFWITGTQTSHLSELAISDFCVVTATELGSNKLYAEGITHPSSEALTHASVYQSNFQAKAVIHVHSPAIWKQTHALKLVHTTGNLAYGSSAMALAVAAMFRQGVLTEQGIFTMLGHEDGVVAFADSLENAGLILIKTLSRALAIDPKMATR